MNVMVQFWLFFGTLFHQCMSCQFWQSDFGSRREPRTVKNLIFLVAFGLGKNLPEGGHFLSHLMSSRADGFIDMG